MRSPSKLRYVECELPSEVEKAISAFEDSFDNSIKPFYDRLADWVANDLPGIQAELDAQVALREELVKGAPVQSLGSLAAIDGATGLTSPLRDDEDPETVRIDERKLGAAGICLLYGRMFRITGGSRLTALRHLWEVAGGDYDYFVRLGTAVFTTPKDSYTLFEYNNSTPNVLPYVNKGFAYLEAVGLKNSQFKHRMVWTRSISSSYALKAKMATLGYTSEQINNTFAGLDPNVDYDYLGAIADINVLTRSVTRLIFLPPTDPIRQPPWENETNYIELAIKKFLIYRTHKYTSSSIFDLDYWLTFLSELRPRDIKELLEERPEVVDIELPQDQASITALVEKAVAVPSETAIINTYMNNLPAKTKEEEDLTNTLYDLGLGIWHELVAINSPRADRLEQLLLELSGLVPPLEFINPDILINPADLSSLFPTANLPPVGQLVSLVQSKGNSKLVKKALAANSATVKYNKTETKNIQQNNLSVPQGSTTNNTPGGLTQGFPSVETFAMLLTRRIDWGSNFMDCSGEQAVGTASTSIEQEMRTVPSLSFDKTESVENNEEWRQHQDNMAYIKVRLGNKLANDSISGIRSGIDSYLSGLVVPPNRTDTNLNKLKEKLNSSNDIKSVAASAVALLKAIPSQKTAEKVRLASEMTGEDRGAAMYAAKNRAFIEDAGGKIPPAGLTQSELKSGLEQALGKPLPFMSKGDNVILPTHGSANVELQFCNNSALKKLSAYGRQFEANRKQLEDWLIKFINIVKHQIITFQDRIDKFILMLQQAMDAIFAKLERLLTLDLNFSGKIGFENSLFKCSWGLDLGLKINLLDLLLMYLDRFLGTIMGPILKGLTLFGDFINQIMCIPIRWLGEILNGAAKALSDLLGQIGCTVKDFKLPSAIFDLLNLINGTFSLRSLVLRKGSADWLKMMARIKLGRNEFAGLSQFASMCANPDISLVLSALQYTSSLMASDIPVGATHRGLDAPGAALGTMTA